MDQKHYVVKNQHLAAELERTLFRILSFENGRKDYVRQRITTGKNHLIQGLKAHSLGEISFA